MTLVYRQPKLKDQMERKVKQQQKIGPGTYSPQLGSIKHNLSLSQSRKNHKASEQSNFQQAKRKVINSESKNDQRIFEAIGPGNYEIDNAHKKFLARIKTNECSSIFKSKIDRFENPTEKRYREMEEIIRDEQQKIIYQILINKKNDSRNGKLFGIERCRQKICQSIPSIPTNDQSYGYRIDPETKKLVINENPHVLLAKKSSKGFDPKELANTLQTIYRGPGSHFLAKNKSNIRAPKWYKDLKNQEEKYLIEKNDQNIKDYQREQLQLRKSSVLVSDQKSWNQKGNPLIQKERRFVDSQNIGLMKKNLLLMNSFEKKFSKYIDDKQMNDIRILMKEKQGFPGQKNKPNNEKENEGRYLSLQNTYQNKIKNQCFLSKDKRFRIKNYQSMEKGKIKCVQRYEQMKETERKNKVKREEEEKKKMADQFNKKHPFISGADRFTYETDGSKNKNVGPATYSIKQFTQTNLPNHALINRSEERFRQLNSFLKTPGPGQYQIVGSKQKNQSRRNPTLQNSFSSKFNKKISFQEGREQSFQIVDIKKQNIKVKNIFNAAKDLENNNIKNSKQKLQKNKILKEIKNILIEQEKQNLIKNINETTCVQNRGLNQLKKPFIPYTPIQKVQNNLGPGSFDIRTSLTRKTHNVTYD